MDGEQALQEYRATIDSCRTRKQQIEQEMSALYREKETILKTIEALSRIVEGLEGLKRIQEGCATNVTTR